MGRADLRTPRSLSLRVRTHTATAMPTCPAPAMARMGRSSVKPWSVMSWACSGVRPWWMPSMTMGRKRLDIMNPPTTPPVLRAKSTSSQVSPFMNRAEMGIMTKTASTAPISSVVTGTRKRSRVAGTTLRTAFSMTAKAPAVTMTPIMPPSPGARSPNSGMVRGCAGAAPVAGMPPSETM